MQRRIPLVTATLAAVCTCLLVAGPTFAASPSLSIIVPRGVQRGTEDVLSFRGRRLKDAREIFFYEPGIEVTQIEAKDDRRVDVHVKVASDCRLGEHVAQVRTATGISDYRTFYVGNLPEVDEEEGANNEFGKAKEIDLDVTVTGRVTNEDVDYFAVQAKKGQRITAEIEAIRLGSALFDPYVAILDTERFVLDSADDTPLVHQDAIASVVAPEDGRYIIEVRESAYGGSGNSRYRLHVGTFPRPLAAYPAGGKKGEKLKVRYLGDAAGEMTETVRVPEQPETDFALFARDEHGIAPSPVPFRPFGHGNVLEQEPNDTRKEASSAELPKAFNGIIAEPGDVDYFRFQAKKGQRYEVECYASRIRSPLDPVMRLYRADNGKRLAADDDSRSLDSHFRFRAPADGEYILEVTDHRKRGGEVFVYRVEFQQREPDLALQIPRTTRYGQERQQIVVPRGNRFATLLNARRRGFRGEVVLKGDNLPEGIKMVSEPMPANMNTMPVVFEASEDAKVGGKLLKFTGRGVNDKGETIVSGHFENSAILVRGRPGNSTYWTREVEQLAVAVTEEAPFQLEIQQPKVPIVRQGEMQLKVIVHRKDGFEDPIRIEFPFRPPGIGAASRRQIGKGKTEVTYPLNANKNARLGEWPVYVIGSADNFWVSSQMARLEVAEPFVEVAMQRAAVEQGQKTEMFGELKVNTEFEGKATAELVGLPGNIEIPEVQFDARQEELVFPVGTTEKSRTGRHKNVICRVVVTQNGEPIIHRAGRSELRIDKPPPEPKKEKKPEKKTAKKKKQPEKKKRLSRLEKLRLEAKKRLQEQNEEDSK